MDKDQLVIATIIGIIIFFYSLELTSFSGYTYLGLIMLSIILYFGTEHIIKMLNNGASIIAVIGFVISMLIIIAILWAGYNIYINKKKINKKWPQYKCRPYIIPFAGWAIGPKSVSPTSNFSECMWNTNKSMFNIMMTPFKDILNQITEILGGIMKDIQNLRKMVNYMRNSLEDVAKDVYKKIWDTYVRLSYLFKKFLVIFEKLGQVFVNLFDVVLYTIYSFGSLWHGVVGKIEKVAEFFCFDGETLINMENGNKKIKDIQVGDILENNNKVIGIIKFDALNVIMYNYNNIIVSADHLVMEDNKWIRVKDSKNGKKMYNYNGLNIYCLITDNNLINIGEHIFKDYNETSNNFIKQQIYNYIINDLNNKNNYYNKDNITLESGIDCNIKILMDDNSSKKIKDISIGENTKYGKVFAISKIKSKNVCRYNNMIMTDNIIIYKNNEWVPVFKQNIEDINYDGILYHLIVEDDIIEIDGIKIRDFEQNSDRDINKRIDNYVLRNL